MLHAGVSGWRCGPTTASPSGRRRARRGRGRRGRARGLDRVSLLCRTPLKESAGRRPSRQQGLLRSPCRPRWVRRRPKRIVVGCRQSPPAAGAAIDGGDGCRNTSDESPRRSRKVVNLHTWPVCAKIAIISGGERRPPKKTRNRRGGSVQPSSPYEVYTAPKSIRSKTLRRRKVWGEPVSMSATYLCDVPSAMCCKFGGERNVVY